MLSAVSRSPELADPELADPERSEGAVNGKVKGKHLACNMRIQDYSRDASVAEFILNAVEGLPQNDGGRGVAEVVTETSLRL